LWLRGKQPIKFMEGFQMTNLEIIIEHLEQNGLDFQYDGNKDTALKKEKKPLLKWTFGQ
jgi:hypothetical protein